MRLLVIGGTVFVGRAVVAAALARGHAVTIFHRGLHNPDLFPEAERVLGDRTLDLSALHGREWDAVIDTCGFEPEHVAATAELLADRVGHYGFVSSVSVYPDSDGTLMTEDSPVFEGAEREYGPLKAACERAAEAAMPGRVLAARAGVIVGPHENIGRLPRWLWRCAECGEVLAPGRHPTLDAAPRRPV
jgi:2'-hydroxyisoflavone reductase